MGRERGPVWVLLGLAPLLGLGVLLAAIVLNGAGIDREDRPPVEDLTIDRVLLPTPDEIVGRVTNGGSQPAAVITPTFSAETFWRYALIGTYVGVIPVALGLLWYPFLRRLGSAGIGAVLALTLGLLVWLVVDTLLEAVEVAGRLPGVFSG